jgi:probable UDP-sugar transporter A4
MFPMMQISNSASLALTMSTTSDDVTYSSKTDNSLLNSRPNPENILYSIKFRAMIFFQILAYGSYSVLVHLCEKNGAITFSSTTMNFLLEFVKLIFSLSALLYSTTITYPNKLQFISWFRQSLPYSIPGILYFINNNLAVHMQVHMDPASYQILSNFKIFTTAILYRLIIKHKLSRQQWFALSLLFLGGLAYSLGTLKNSSFVSKKMTSSSIIMPEMYIHPLGIPMIAIYCTISGLAGVYNEWILKKHYTESLHLQNVFLYSYGTILNFVPAFTSAMLTSQTGHSFNLFRGFTLYTWIIVITQALNGLFMSVVIKHSSNIIRLFVISFSLIVTALLSLFIFHISFNIYFFISFFTMISALSLYYSN